MTIGGYSKKTIERIENATLPGVGVELGRLCVLHNYSVQEVAEVFGVSRPTIYNWITGATTPHKYLEGKIQSLVEKLKLKPLPDPALDDENE